MDNKGENQRTSENTQHVPVLPIKKKGGGQISPITQIEGYEEKAIM